MEVLEDDVVQANCDENDLWPWSWTHVHPRQRIHFQLSTECCRCWY